MITKQCAHIWRNYIVRATRDGDAPAAANDKQVVHSSKLMNSKDVSMAALDPQRWADAMSAFAVVYREAWAGGLADTSGYPDDQGGQQWLQGFQEGVI